MWSEAGEKCRSQKTEQNLYDEMIISGFCMVYLFNIYILFSQEIQY